MATRPTTNKHPQDNESGLDFLRAPSSYSVRVGYESVTLLDRVLEKLRGAILEFHFHPGDRLIERDLCEQLGVSRSSVREALRRLEAEGLVTIVPHKGGVVASTTSKEAQAIYEVRGVLEGFAAQLFAERASNEQVLQLRERLRDMREAVKTGDPRIMLAVKGTFYDVILEGCGNEFCRQLILSLQARIRFLRALALCSPERTKRSLDEMAQIVKAIEARDGNAARAAYLVHIEEAARAAIKALSERPPRPHSNDAHVKNRL